MSRGLLNTRTLGQLLLNGPSGSEIDESRILSAVVATGQTIAAGDFVKLTNDQASEIGDVSDDTLNVISQSGYLTGHYMIKVNSTQYLVVGVDVDEDLKAVLINVSKTSDGKAVPAWQTAQEFYTGTADSRVRACLIDTNKVLIAYEASNLTYVIAATVGATSLTFGSAVQVNTGSSYEMGPVLCCVGTNRAIVANCDNAADRLYCTEITVSGTTVTAQTGGSAYISFTGVGDDNEIVRLADSYALVVYPTNSNATLDSCVVYADPDTHAITFGTPVQLHSSGWQASSYEFEEAIGSCALTSTKIGLVFINASDKKPIAKVGTFNTGDRSISYGSATELGVAATSTYVPAVSVTPSMTEDLTWWVGYDDTMKLIKIRWSDTGGFVNVWTCPVDLYDGLAIAVAPRIHELEFTSSSYNDPYLEFLASWSISANSLKYTKVFVLSVPLTDTIAVALQSGSAGETIQILRPQLP